MFCYFSSEYIVSELQPQQRSNNVHTQRNNKISREVQEGNRFKYATVKKQIYFQLNNAKMQES